MTRPNRLPSALLEGLLLALLLLPAGLVAQQSPEAWDPARLQVTRPELEDLLARYEAVAQSSAYSGGVREDARRAAQRIRMRLENGDFGVGDRIWLTVDGETTVPDTIVVEPGPAITLPNMGRISLQGVLRSELQDHMTRELARFIQNPDVRTQSMIRLQVRGAVGSQGFPTLPSDMLLSDALMASGSLAQTADWDEIYVERAGDRLLEKEEVTRALADGRSLDQLGLQAGDIIVVPADEPSRIWPVVFRWSAIIVSTTLLGIRIF